MQIHISFSRKGFDNAIADEDFSDTRIDMDKSFPSYAAYVVRAVAAALGCSVSYDLHGMSYIEDSYTIDSVATENAAVEAAIQEAFEAAMGGMNDEEWLVTMP